MYLHTFRIKIFSNTQALDFQCAVCGLISNDTDFGRLAAENPALSAVFKRDELFSIINCPVINNVFFCEPCVLKSRQVPVEISEEKLLSINHGIDHWKVAYPNLPERRPQFDYHCH